MNTPTTFDLQAAVTAEFLRLAGLLEELPDSRWETPSLCAGWGIREVVAHLSMAVRYSASEFMAELEDCEGDFTRLSNRVATRDAALPAATLIGNLRDDVMHRWTPPGGGQAGALNHVVIHGLDITVPLGITERPPNETMQAVLDHLTHGGAHAYFGFDLAGLRLETTDLEWSFGSGAPLRGTAADLALHICGRTVPASVVRNQPDWVVPD
jgi:uncharacterized protein (TIGR03083 family)